jgi:hypothetical protein
MENDLVISKEEIIRTYGKIYEVNATIEPDGEDSQKVETFYFTKPKTQSFSRYIKKVSTNAYEAGVTLVKDNIIIEQQDDLNKIIEEYPAIILNLSEKLLAMLGFATDVNFKKL